MGALAGHMRHLYDDLDLTFGDLKEILRKATEGSLELVEKVDGINMFFTVDPVGRVKFARRKSDIKTASTTLPEMRRRFGGHPAEEQIIESCAAIDRRLAFAAGPYFGSGRKNWVNAELIYAKKPVSIPYSHNAIVLHEMKAFGPSGEELSINLSGRFDALCSVFPGADDGWSYYGPIPIVLPSRFGEGFYTEALGSLEEFQGSCSDADTLRDRLWIFCPSRIG